MLFFVENKSIPLNMKTLLNPRVIRYCIDLLLFKKQYRIHIVFNCPFIETSHPPFIETSHPVLKSILTIRLKQLSLRQTTMIGDNDQASFS